MSICCVHASAEVGAEPPALVHHVLHLDQMLPSRGLAASRYRVSIVTDPVDVRTLYKLSDVSINIDVNKFVF